MEKNATRQNPINVGYKNIYERMIGEILESSGISHGYESMCVNLDPNNGRRFTPDFALGMLREGRQVVLEIHGFSLLDLDFAENVFMARQRERKYYYILAMDATAEEFAGRLKELGFRIDDLCDEFWPLPNKATYNRFAISYGVYSGHVREGLEIYIKNLHDFCTGKAAKGAMRR